jgi:hypothetical protein
MLYTINSIVKRCSILLVLIAPLSACQNGADDDPKTSAFDRKEMLSYYANSIIKPRYLNLQLAVEQLQVVTRNFANQPTMQNLEVAKSTWLDTYLTWQYANSFNFGPAGEQGINKGLIEEIGTYPTSAVKIETTIKSGQFNFNNFDRDARGFLAVEYLLYSASPAETISLFTDQKRKDFLLAAVENIKTRVDKVAVEWNAYANEFIANDGTDVGSSTSALYNEFVRNYEGLKNFKVGLPLGKRPGQTKAEPTKVETYYSGQSLACIKANYIALEDFYYGKSADGNRGISFKTYLENVEGGKALVASTEAQLASIRTALNAIPSTVPFSQIIINNAATVDALHTELQKNTRFFKSDMSSILGIAITFASGDGD